jgi:alkylation response protein AidB-like acyl-CoA dehydrogenase
MIARTDTEAPKHRGLSFFLVDKRSPGITVQPLIHMADKHDFNQVFFDNVRVPADQMVGRENEGWAVALALLDFERLSSGSIAAIRRRIEEWTAHARDNGLLDSVGGRTIRTGLAQLRIEQEVVRLMAYKVAYDLDEGHVPSYEASMIKVFVSELDQRLYNFGMNMLGLEGQLIGGPEAPFDGIVPMNHMWMVAPTIYSGTNEIQRNIIAQRGLGLPR